MWAFVLSPISSLFVTPDWNSVRGLRERLNRDVLMIALPALFSFLVVVLDSVATQRPAHYVLANPVTRRAGDMSFPVAPTRRSASSIFQPVGVEFTSLTMKCTA